MKPPFKANMDLCEVVLPISIFAQTYSGESIIDMQRDVHEAICEEFNPAVATIPKDEYGFQQGTFKVTIEWIPS